MGGDAGGPVNLVETLYSNGTRMQCILPDLNIGIGHTMNGFVVCGGQICSTLTGGEWRATHDLNYGRAFHTSWSVADEIILLGGLNSPTTTDIVTPRSSTATKGFRLVYNTR